MARSRMVAAASGRACRPSQSRCSSRRPCQPGTTPTFTPTSPSSPATATTCRSADSRRPGLYMNAQTTAGPWAPHHLCLPRDEIFTIQQQGSEHCSTFSQAEPTVQMVWEFSKPGSHERCRDGVPCSCVPLTWRGCVADVARCRRDRWRST